MDTVSLGTTPIAGENPVGIDAKYEPEYEALLAEIEKLGSATSGEAISWPAVAEFAGAILEKKSKDILVAAYLGVALEEMQGPTGLLKAARLLYGLLSTYWETAFPPLNRMRRRVNAIDWWREKTLVMLRAYEEPPLEPETADALHVALEELDTLTGELMPDAMPLRDIKELVRRLPVLPSESEKNQEAAPQTLPETNAHLKPVAPEPTDPQAEKASPPSGENAGEASAQQHTVESPVQQPAMQKAAPATPTPKAEPTADSGVKPAAGELTEEALTAQKNFIAAAGKYALAAHRCVPADPLPWQLLRIALWCRVRELPPATAGQTLLQPPDPQLLTALKNLLTQGKFLEAALAGEDLFVSSLFCLDVQALIDAALEGLGAKYASARERVREETRNFVRRLPGIELLQFTDGTPFADQDTQTWLTGLMEEPQDLQPCVSASRPVAPVDVGQAEVIAQAEALAAKQQIDKALDLLDNAKGCSQLGNMRLKIIQLNLLCRAGESRVAVALATGLLDELDARNIEELDASFAVDVLLACRDAFALAREKDRVTAMLTRLAGLRPSAALSRRND